MMAARLLQRPPRFPAQWLWTWSPQLELGWNMRAIFFQSSLSQSSRGCVGTHTHHTGHTHHHICTHTTTDTRAAHNVLVHNVDTTHTHTHTFSWVKARAERGNGRTGAVAYSWAYRCWWHTRVALHSLAYCRPGPGQPLLHYTRTADPKFPHHITNTHAHTQHTQDTQTHAEHAGQDTILATHIKPGKRCT